MFQFQYGAIKSKHPCSQNDQVLVGFNSNMVRLRDF